MKIKDKFNFLHTNSFSRDKLSDTEGTVKNIHYGDIHTTYPTIVEQIPFINASKVQNKDLDKYDFCKNGDLLIANASEDYEDIGKTIELIHITNSKVIGGLHTILLRDKTNDNALGFNGYYFQTKYFKKQIKIIANGVSVLGINKKDLKELTIKTPFKKEQENIASFLFNIDKKLKLLKNKKVGFIEFKHYLLQNLFPQNGKTAPILRFEEFTEEWKSVQIKDIFSERNETNFDELALLSVTLNNGVIPRSEIDGKDNSINNKNNYKHVKPQDIVYNSMRMWQGANGVSTLEGIVSPAYTVLIPKKDICSDFYGYYFKINRMLNEFKKYSQGLTSDTWNLKYPLISQITIKTTSREEQEKIASFLSFVDKKIDLLYQEIEQVEEYKKGLLQKMFI